MLVRLYFPPTVAKNKVFYYTVTFGAINLLFCADQILELGIKSSYRYDDVQSQFVNDMNVQLQFVNDMIRLFNR
jgi:hypothetical protein